MNETLAYSPIRSESAIEARFTALAAVWKEETMPLSSSSQMTAHPAYQAIIALGPDAIPLLSRELERRPDHWFAALRALTGANPVSSEQQGRVGEMVAAWLHWAKSQGYTW